MMREVLLLALLGVCCGSILEKSLKFSSMRKGIGRFAMNIPEEAEQVESAVDKLKGNSDLKTKLQKLSDALLIRGQPLGSFKPHAFQPFTGPLPKQNEVRPGNLKSYSFKSCSKKPQMDTFVINQMLVNPDPLHFPGKLTLVFNITITMDIEHLTAALEVKRKFGETYVKIPCVGQYGSCTYDVCSMLEDVQTCPSELTQLKFNCKCPFNKGFYVTEKSGIAFEIDTEVFPTGDYMVTANLTTPDSSASSAGFSDSKEAGCYIVTLSIS